MKDKMEKLAVGWHECGAFRIENRGSGIYGIFERDDRAFIYKRSVRARSPLAALTKYFDDTADSASDI